VKFCPTFSNFILGLYCAEKIHTSTCIYCLHPGKEARPLTNHKKKIRGRKGRTFCFRKTSFVHSQSGTYYALLLGYFGLNFLPDICHCVYWFLAEIWARNSSHRICIKFSIHLCQGWKGGSFECETVWFFCVGEYSSVWPEICRILSQIHLRFLHEISGKHYFGRIFQKFCANQGYLSSTQTCEISPYFMQFCYGSLLRWKKSHNNLHMLFASM